MHRLHSPAAPPAAAAAPAAHEPVMPRVPVWTKATNKVMAGRGNWRASGVGRNGDADLLGEDDDDDEQQTLGDMLAKLHR